MRKREVFKFRGFIFLAVCRVGVNVNVLLCVVHGGFFFGV